jgi:serine/threonine protein kinase
MDSGDLLGGRYHLVRELANGGMSVVWLAQDEVLGRAVAVKMAAPGRAGGVPQLDEVKTEALAIAQLSHPNIVGVYDYGETVDGVAYVVMELVQGPTFASLLEHPVSWRYAVGVCARVADALAVTHAQGVVHRDVTPKNIIVSNAGVKLVDFGISASVGAPDTTPANTVLGTPAYLAPERLDHAVAHPAADLYGLGLVLYRALAGRLPWDADTVIDMLRAQYYVDPAPLPDIAGLPPAVAQVCHQCLAKNPADRPDAITVATTLSLATDATHPLPIPTEPAPVPRGRAPVAAMVATLVVLGLLLAGASPAASRFDLPGLNRAVESWGSSAGAAPAAPAAQPPTVVPAANTHNAASPGKKKNDKGPGKHHDDGKGPGKH